ncbi:anti-sigma factor [Desulfoluna sp.]|uniref:anti-sigma factor family protein n=1 Tax=Desulfoluna sp. TaxID=2045199 RepID=UPI00263880E0|nr:zf-HC2 domain-containing protein [Desulfoluna sp.]
MEHPHEKTLHAYVDRTLDRQREAALHAHLAQCPRCRAEVNELTRLFDEFKHLPAPAPNRELTTRILLARERETRSPYVSFDFFGFLFGRIGWAVVLVGLLTGGLLGYSAQGAWDSNATDLEIASIKADQEDPYLGYLLSDNGDIL